MKQPASMETHGLLLQPGETLLWTDQPRVRVVKNATFWRRKFRTMAWSLVPIAWLGLCVYFLNSNPNQGIFWFSGFFCVLWLYIAFSSLVITPITSARRRRRTRHWLTSVRAVTRQSTGGVTAIHSHFLDMASGISVILNDDGSGDVSIAPQAGFQNIENAAEVHHLLIEAVRAIGGPLARPAAAGLDALDDSE